MVQLSNKIVRFTCDSIPKANTTHYRDLSSKWDTQPTEPSALNYMFDKNSLCPSLNPNWSTNNEVNAEQAGAPGFFTFNLRPGVLINLIDCGSHHLRRAVLCTQLVQCLRGRFEAIPVAHCSHLLLTLCTIHISVNLMSKAHTPHEYIYCRTTHAHTHSSGFMTLQYEHFNT